MTAQQDVFCLIPAKAASTRLKKKNIVLLNERPLISYAIANAIECGLFSPSDIIVSTESEEVAEVSRAAGARVPYQRDEKLAHDPYGIVDVALDFFEQLPEYKSYKTLAILLPTAPLTTVEDLREAYSQFLSGENEVLMSVTAHEHSAYRAVVMDDGKINPVFPDKIRKRSQELPVTYRLNGAMVFINVDSFLEAKTYFLDSIGAYEMEWENSIDIDNEEDLLLAEFLIAKSKEH